MSYSLGKYKVMKTFVCRSCMNPVTGRGRTYWYQCKSEVSG